MQRGRRGWKAAIRKHLAQSAWTKGRQRHVTEADAGAYSTPAFHTTPRLLDKATGYTAERLTCAQTPR